MISVPLSSEVRTLKWMMSRRIVQIYYLLGDSFFFFKKKKGTMAVEHGAASLFLWTNCVPKSLANLLKGWKEKGEIGNTKNLSLKEVVAKRVACILWKKKYQIFF